MHSLLFVVLGLISVLLGSFAIERILPDHLKKYSFALGLTLITLVLYYSTFGSGFYHGQHLIYLVSFVTLVQDLFVSRGRRLGQFIKSNKVFFIGSWIWLATSVQAELSQWDEFSWGAFAKHINHYGAYWDSKAAILSQHLRYLPGLTLWENFFLGQDVYTEGPLYFSLGLIFLAGLVAIWPRQANLKNLAVTILLFASVTVWFSTGLTTIYVDSVMGVLMGLILLAIDDASNPWELAAALILSLFLALTKESGLILALICLFAVFIKAFRLKEFGPKRFAVVAAGFAALLLNQIFWKKYLQTDPQITGFDSGPVFQRITSDLQELSAQSKETLGMVGHALIGRPFPRALLTETPFSQTASFIGSWFFWTPLFATLLLTIRKKYEFIITFILGLLGYTSFLVLAYLYFFAEYERQILVSYERYLGVYFLAFALFGIKLIVDQELYKNKKVAFCLIALVAVFRPTPSILIPISVRRDVTGFRKDLRPISTRITSSTPVNSNIWFIWQNSTGLEAMIIRYEIAPRLMNPGGWSLGEPYYPGDVWTQNLSVDQLTESLKTYDYVAFGKLDEKFSQKYGHLFEPAPQEETLYKKIEGKNEKFRLLEAR